MTGKTHMMIGAVLAGGVSYLLKEPTVMLVGGSVVGSLIVDIDSKKSKASQTFNRVLTYTVWAMVLNKFTNFTFIENFLRADSVIGNMSIVLFAILTTLGKMSPHRGFTHKWFGTLLFCLSAITVFSKEVALGFVVGYIAHLLADKQTDKGLKIFEFRLPLQDAKGKLKYHF